MKLRSFYILTLTLFVFFSCDHGLDPDFNPGFEGTVTIIDGWAEDSEVRQMYVAVFKRIPVDMDDAYNQFLAGDVRYTGLTPPFLDEYGYSFNIDPGIYELLICIGVEGEQFLNVEDWVIAGIYSDTENPAGFAPVEVPDDERLEGVDINASVIDTIPIDNFFND